MFAAASAIACNSDSDSSTGGNDAAAGDSGDGGNTGGVGSSAGGSSSTGGVATGTAGTGSNAGGDGGNIGIGGSTAVGGTSSTGGSNSVSNTIVGTPGISCGDHTCQSGPEVWEVCCWDKQAGEGSCAPMGDCPTGPNTADLRCDSPSEAEEGLASLYCCFDTHADGSASSNWSDGGCARDLTLPGTVGLCDPLSADETCDCRPAESDDWLPPGFHECF